uniref:Uncharacterized protein n=1 Tax=Knipowitschia caucasica TaxID=637954 RepID=A0AAV2J2W5_KNICA
MNGGIISVIPSPPKHETISPPGPRRVGPLRGDEPGEKQISSVQLSGTSLPSRLSCSYSLIISAPFPVIYVDIDQSTGAGGGGRRGGETRERGKTHS